jgi:hypothetical protein
MDYAELANYVLVLLLCGVLSLIGMFVFVAIYERVLAFFLPPSSNKQIETTEGAVQSLLIK